MPADRRPRSSVGRAASPPTDGEPDRLCPACHAEFGGRQQREHRRPDSADSPPRGRSGHRTRGVRLQPGKISSIIPVGEQFAILKCEGQLAGPQRADRKRPRGARSKQIKEEKLRGRGQRHCSKSCKNRPPIQNVWNDPQLRAQMPGVVATINGEPIAYQELAEECLLRYRRRGAGSRDFALAAAASTGQGEPRRHRAGPQRRNRATRRSWPASSTPRAQPDFDKWMQMATDGAGHLEGAIHARFGLAVGGAQEAHRRLRFKSPNDDMQKGFEANYAERVRCRAIVLGNMRRAQEVWAKARQNPSMDYFGDLAEEYSDRAHQQVAARRGAANPPVRRPAAARGRGLRSSSRANFPASSRWATNS